MPNRDYLLDANGDPLIKDGDFVVGDSDDQHIQDVIVSFLGEWKQDPTIGCEILTSLYSSTPQNDINNVKTQLQKAGYQLNQLNIFIDTNNKLRITFTQGIIKNA
ncbi:MAG TPA: hypothetical protein VN026_18130 [Bacteroidia bacterium]|jgi:hypothetical protein|nr:hypothetical protein [Bacteroidia bacterium]